jgi:hypothetical protein
MEAVLKHGGGVEAWMAHRSKDGTPRHGRRTEARMAHRGMDGAPKHGWRTEAWRRGDIPLFSFFSFFLLPLSPFPFPFPFPSYFSLPLFYEPTHE